MGETFQKEIQVMEYESDVQRRIRLSAIMHHAQQIGGDHLMTKNVGYRQMYEDGMVFVVNKMKISIIRRPEFGEHLLLTTIPMEPKGIQFIRDTHFETLTGEQLIKVSISWALIHPETRRLLRPRVFERYGFEFMPNQEETVTGYKIQKPAGSPILHHRQVKYSDLDYNNHVNNAVYADMICDMMPIAEIGSEEIENFGIIYHKEALLGQVIDVNAIQNENGWYFGGAIGQERCFEAEITFQSKGVHKTMHSSK